MVESVMNDAVDASMQSTAFILTYGTHPSATASLVDHLRSPISEIIDPRQSGICCGGLSDSPFPPFATSWTERPWRKTESLLHASSAKAAEIHRLGQSDAAPSTELPPYADD